LIDEEDVRHVEAMHYTATVKIRVRREDLKPIKTIAGFWPTVFAYEKKGKIDSKDLEFTGRNVKRVTGWTDPINNITSFAKVVCNNYKALMDEKRKRTADDDGVSKRPNTRNGKREEQVQPTAQREVGETSGNPCGTSQPAQMEVNDSAKKGKEHTMPTY
jgi:hypothetical protein